MTARSQVQSAMNYQTFLHPLSDHGAIVVGHFVVAGGGRFRLWRNWQPRTRVGGLDLPPALQDPVPRIAGAGRCTALWGAAEVCAAPASPGIVLVLGIFEW